MKIKKTIFTAAILMAAVCLPAQNKSAGINISIWKDICTQPHDSTQTTYVNIGLLSTMNRLNGVGINALGSVVHGDMNGVQITGLANLAGGTMRGVQLAGISNISGNNTVGLSAAGLVNITGDRTQGVIISGLTSIGGDNTSGLMISGFMNVTGNMASGLHFSGAANITGQSFGVRFKNQLFYTILGIGSMYQGLNDKFSASASYRAGLSFTLYKGLSISGDLGYQHIEAFDNKDEVIPKRLYALQARANLEYQITRKFGIYATGGYGLTRFYNKSSNYDKGAIIEAGIVLF